MQAFTRHSGMVLPFDRRNVDTDAILPKQYLKSIELFGFADWLFDDERYLDPGDVKTDVKTRRLNTEFVLNKPEYAGASILLARDNFGCGSSREHAVWALRDYGIRAVIAPSFADIFYSNCFKNAILPVTLLPAEVEELFVLTAGSEPLQLNIDLHSCTINSESKVSWRFEVDEARRQNLLEGKDEIAVTLEHEKRIREFEAKVFASEPWLQAGVSSSES